MASDGTPELAAIRCGEAIARIRTRRGWTRTQLLTRLLHELSPSDPYYESVSETWLARLENGRMVKVPRQTVEALCRALRCNARERAWVLLHADRNVLAEPASEPTPAAEALTYVMERLYVESRDNLNAVLVSQEGADLCELELFELAATVLEQALARRRRAAMSASGMSASGMSASAMAANGHHAQQMQRGVPQRVSQRVS